MTLTIMSAAKEVASLENLDMESLARAISSGSLRGARGNSGVILSQLFRGFTKESSTMRRWTRLFWRLPCRRLWRLLQGGYEAERGTILTVAKGAADKAAELAETDVEMKEFIQQVIDHADFVLSQTPEMLPVLKEARGS